MKRIVVLYGGTTSEREVSIKSGKAVIKGLEAIGHDVVGHCLDRDSLDGVDLSSADFVFIALHGGWGEGGGLQSELEQRGIPFSGSDSVACHLAMDKELAKARFIAARVPTPIAVASSADDGMKRFKRLAQRVGYPLAVKPTCQGSSVGVSIVQNIEEAEAALEKAFSHGERVLIEQGVVGREFSVPVIGSRAYPIVEISSTKKLFDYDAKYKDPATVYNVSPDLPGMTIRVAQYYARRAHDALRCNGYSRVDMMLSESGQFYVLEVNTAPGMTERSLVPLCAQAAQMSFEETLQAIIDASLHPRNAEPQRPSDRLKAAIAKMAG